MTRNSSASVATPGATGEGRRLAAVIGSPVGHSLSPAMHNSAFGHWGRAWHYFAVECGTAELGGVLEAVRTLPFGGLSVTTPLKEAVIDHLDDVSPESDGLRSVNCIVARDGHLSGHVTDGLGCVEALVHAGTELTNVSVTLLGAGGTARSIAAAVAATGASVTVVNRSPHNAERLCALVQSMVPEASISAAPDTPGASRDAVRSAQVLINATSAGMNAEPDDEPVIEAEWLHGAQTILDAVYQPLETPLLSAARRCSATVVDGLWMLVHQAAHQQALWFGLDAVDVVATAAVMRAAAERQLFLRRR